MQIHGIGTTLLGVSEQDSENCATATQWFTVLHLPVLPLTRLHVQFLPHTGSGFSYAVLNRESPRRAEVLTTYFFGWIVMPLLVLGPLIPAVSEVWQALGLPPDLQNYYMGFAILWFIIAVLKLDNWQEQRCHPRHRPLEEPDPPVREPFPWKVMAAPLAFIGITVALAVYLMIERIGPAGWLIDLQIQWWGGYYVEVTFAILWIGIVLGILLIIGGMASLWERIKKRKSPDSNV